MSLSLFAGQSRDQKSRALDLTLEASEIDCFAGRVAALADRTEADQPVHLVCYEGDIASASQLELR